jgi:hypothetical protein
LTPVFDRAVDSLCAALHPDTTRHYRGTAHNFLKYLSTAYPAVTSLDLLRRDPHVLGWMSRLRAQAPPLVTASYINLLLALRRIFAELAWMEQHPELVHLIPQDIPPAAQASRPLTAEQDQLLQQEPSDVTTWAPTLVDSPHGYAHWRVSTRPSIASAPGPD